MTIIKPLKRIYEPRAYEAATGQESFWSETACAASFERLESDISVDVAVVGAGYAGLNSALQLCREHQRSVAVLDAHWAGWGASGRNGGFCCIGGSKLSYAQLLKRWGDAEAQSFADTQRHAIAHVQSLLQSEGIDAGVSGVGELCIAHNAAAAKSFGAEAELISRVHGVQAQHWSAAEMQERGAVVHGHADGLYSPLGFGLNPWQYVTGLAKTCLDAGVQLYGESPVQAMQPSGEGWLLRTPTAVVKAKKIIIASNGYSSENLPNWIAGRYLPVQSSIIVTRALSKSELQAQGFSTDIMSYDSRTLLHYFRVLPDGRFMIGMRGGRRASTAAYKKIKAQAQQDFKRMFPAWADVEQTHFWSGLVCLTGSLQPFVGKIPECNNAYAAFGWHGNGVALGSYSGKLLADEIAGAHTAAKIPSAMSSVPPKMPFGRFRRGLLLPAYAMAQLADSRR